MVELEMLVVCMNISSLPSFLSVFVVILYLEGHTFLVPKIDHIRMNHYTIIAPVFYPQILPFLCMMVKLGICVNMTPEVC